MIRPPDRCGLGFAQCALAAIAGGAVPDLESQQGPARSTTAARWRYNNAGRRKNSTLHGVVFQKNESPYRPAPSDRMNPRLAFLGPSFGRPRSARDEEDMRISRNAERPVDRALATLRPMSAPSSP